MVKQRFDVCGADSLVVGIPEKQSAIIDSNVSLAFFDIL